MKRRILLLITLLLFTGCAEKGPIKKDYSSVKPEDTIFYENYGKTSTHCFSSCKKQDSISTILEGDYEEIIEKYTVVIPGGKGSASSNKTQTETKKESNTNQSSSNTDNSSNQETTTPGKEKPTTTKNNLVSYNGNLHISGTDIVNQYGEKLQLKGISSHGLQWYGEYITDNNIKTLKNEWKSNLIRLAMYTEENGYISNRNLLNVVEKDIELAIANDMYVIVDWHILSDGNPKTHQTEAKEFFEYISAKYKNTPNIIYEICNEPNGDVTWSRDIKPYATDIISTIRKNSNNIIVVGTGTWSQDVLDPLKDPLSGKNIMYTAHFYAGTHTEWLRDRVKQAIAAGLPIFVTEWGTSSADGNGGVYLEESQKWVDFMKDYNISWANWSLCDKGESSALLKNGVGSQSLADEYLSESGKFVKKAIQG